MRRSKELLVLILLFLVVISCTTNDDKELVETIVITEILSSSDGAFLATMQITDSEINNLFITGYSIPLTLTKSNSTRETTYTIYRPKVSDTSKDETAVNDVTTTDVQELCPLSSAGADATRLATYKENSDCTIESGVVIEGDVKLDFDIIGTALYGVVLTGETNALSGSFSDNGRNYNLRFGTQFSRTTSALENPIKIKLTELHILLYEAIGTIVY